MADKKRTRSMVAGIVVSAVGLVACSSSSGESPAGTNSSAASLTPTTNAANCPSWTGELDAYGTAGPDVTHPGTMAAFDFDLMSITPAPPALGTTTWLLKVTDATGQPVTDATFPAIKTWMPQHQHPSTALPTASSNGDGTYTIDNLYLYMPGVWQVTFTAKSGDTTDSAMFSFCLGS
jgi:hypothetical protein